MDAGDWIAVVAGLVGVGGLFYGRVNAVAAKAAAKSSDRSADASVLSAEASLKSATEAASITALEQARRADELEARHDARRPQSPGFMDGTLSVEGARSALMSHIMVHRQYRVRADAIYETGGRTQLSMQAILEPNTIYGFQIEPWHDEQETPRTREIHFRFWPPLESETTDAWTCRCGRPTGENPDGDGHWEWRVPVRYFPQG